MMSEIILSICIPTYNHSSFLREAIESIFNQTKPEYFNKVEIVVSDNASSDATKETIELLKNRNNLLISYFINEKNIGFDGNCLKVIEHAKGRYCWLLGDDDLLAPGALGAVLSEIEENESIDVFMGNKEDFYLTPDRPMKFRRILSLNQSRIFDFQKKGTIDDYFKINKKLIGLFNFISAMIVRREKWQQIKGKEKFIGSGYIHVYMIMAMLFSNMGKLKYLADVLVKRRWGEDRVADIEKRLRYDVLSFHTISEAIFKERRYVRCVDRLVIKNDGFSWAVRAKSTRPMNFYLVVFPFLFRYYWSFPLFWLKMVPLLLVPNILLRFMRQTYRKLIKGESIALNELFVS